MTSTSKLNSYPQTTIGRLASSESWIITRSFLESTQDCQCRVLFQNLKEFFPRDLGGDITVRLLPTFSFGFFFELIQVQTYCGSDILQCLFLSPTMTEHAHLQASCSKKPSFRVLLDINAKSPAGQDLTCCTPSTNRLRQFVPQPSAVHSTTPRNRGTERCRNDCRELGLDALATDFQ
jgi:hypothetical protein